jgi:hypothetical protein
MRVKLRSYPQEHIIRPLLSSIHANEFPLTLIAICGDRMAVKDVAETQIAGIFFTTHVCFFRCGPRSAVRG